MRTDTVIFDMDGLLIDSEPLWEEAAAEVLQEFNIRLTTEQYHDTRGLRTEEWIAHWLHYFKKDLRFVNDAMEQIIKKAIEKIDSRGAGMPGVQEVFALFKANHYKIGLATSSPMEVVHVVAAKLNIGHHLQAMTSAQFLEFGKPHPEVYLACAAELQSLPVRCICFEDSFNGMIAAKAARMKCVVVPDQQMRRQSRWNAADLQLDSLLHFGDNELKLFH
ncbi:hexitol phosphatase HxpB [Agriterribacter sp.]|uniref:hexitol phosphatase HxpB n=1 Tax=Agriterribacter sp. TaxID=2821509 RepID=UPI002B70277D|nr:hexitol phosphatase HxpB [Agriterribacter sp.]HRP56109.1 hexitol phosphatase HxpB [Agriterribacter sp.]